MATEVYNRFLDGRGAAIGLTNKIVDPTYGGQGGYGPDLRYWQNNANQKRQNVVPILLEAPRGFQYLNDPEIRTQNLRAIMELLPRTIDGLDATLQVQTDGTPVGGDGQMQQEFTNVTRAVTVPTFGFDEKYGRAISLNFEDMVLQLMADPATKVANMMTFDGERPTDMLPDQYSFSMLFLEPDPTWQHVIKAFVCVNMFPDGKVGDYTASRDVTAPMNLINFTQQFTALTSVGPGINLLASTILQTLRITNANPNYRASFIKEIAPDVLAAARGFGPQMEEFAADNINLQGG